ncbi:30S ribosomal protein S30 [Legionella norrlandica]|uniref:30S ribosomal protein S30 n=1 Tax=Legionella norrlandica TaxID=1498499 RepID=A0A0A2SVQ9_9GAMM|nr:HPF/RaiA family ribosome-associated protein [Legionella norrlandica]KGP63504.1 30S ribosomal protein S30 [Legionella norrlandica]
MLLPIQVTFRNMDPSEAVESKARKLAKKLDSLYDKIMGCRVVIESPHRHHYKGKLYHVRIDVTVPDAELVVSHESSDKHAHEDVYVSLRDAFNAITRQLKSYANQRRGHVKRHKDSIRGGKVLEVCPMADYGYIETYDGRLIRFTGQSVIDYDFDKLEVGDRVRFVEVDRTTEVPAASTVYVEGKRHIVN